MAKINHLEMGDYVMSLEDIQVKKSFMGLSTKLIYKPTNSVIKIKEKEYSVEDGRKLEELLSTSQESMEATINNLSVSSIGMGNAKLQACLSDDHQFAAVQLLTFKDFDYQPISDVKVYTGKTAEAFTKLL